MGRIAVAIAVLFGLLPAPVLAGTPSGSVNNDGSITATTGSNGSSAEPGSSGAGGGGGSAAKPVCTSWTRAHHPDGRWEQQWSTGTATWWVRRCLINGRWVDQAEPRVQREQQQTDPATLRQRAFDSVTKRLPLPLPRLAPAPELGVVQVGAWFWTEPSMWNPVTARAEVPGAWAEVTATPTTLRYQPGDGALGSGDATCAGPGPVWTPAAGDLAPSPCMYTYTHSSRLAPGGRWPAQLSIEWTVRYRLSDGRSGSLQRLTTAAPVAVTVQEIQALVSG
jgi:hypothetical protein